MEMSPQEATALIATQTVNLFRAMNRIAELEAKIRELEKVKADKKDE